jgi:large subunit ribosomal protein L24
MGRRAVVVKRRTLKIRAGDQVRVIAGKDRGKSGRVLRTDPKHERVYVEHLNMAKRHMRPQQGRDTSAFGGPGQTVRGGVIEREGPIHISNVMLLDPKGGQPTRVRIDRTGGERSRVAKRSGAPID